VNSGLVGRMCIRTSIILKRLKEEFVSLIWETPGEGRRRERRRSEMIGSEVEGGEIVSVVIYFDSSFAMTGVLDDDVVVFVERLITPLVG
jgi:hypothetical protein